MGLFEGSIEGAVPLVPAGPTDFQWDCVFVPNGHTQTFAEMGPAKDAISMRRKALDQFAQYLKTCEGVK
nr:non-canonical purine NTP pyrophosphatase [Pseudomonas savastanoi]